MNNSERTWRGLLLEHESAPSSTIEAVMFELREYGIPQLEKSNTQRRLADLSAAQLRQIIERLIRLNPRYQRITDELIFTLREQLK